MGGNLKVWVFNFRGKIFGGNTTVYISSGETNTVYRSAQLLPIWARAFSLNSRLKALDVTDLGSKGAYGIGGLSREKYAKFSQKYCS